MCSHVPIDSSFRYVMTHPEAQGTVRPIKLKKTLTKFVCLSAGALEGFCLHMCDFTRTLARGVALRKTLVNIARGFVYGPHFGVVSAGWLSASWHRAKSAGHIKRLVLNPYYIVWDQMNECTLFYRI